MFLKKKFYFMQTANIKEKLWKKDELEAAQHAAVSLLVNIYNT